MMDLLFKRSQLPTATGKVNFGLWSKLELDPDEKALVKKYRLDDALLILVAEDELQKKAQYVGVAAACVIGFPLFGAQLHPLVLLAIAGGVGYAAYYWYKHQYRETLYVGDLLHGRSFKCDSVIDLARKEAWITTLIQYFRQVVESAKHWDGPERHRIEALPPDEARQVIIQGI